ncbi:hypothetical protein TNCV_571241 [Trichonephila clavipes]|nr:hypothetical protein TNCV_571241 [Trichonephila clavipes]
MTPQIAPPLLTSTPSGSSPSLDHVWRSIAELGSCAKKNQQSSPNFHSTRTGGRLNLDIFKGCPACP